MSIFKLTFTDKAGNETATGKEYKSKATATRAGNKAVKDSPKPITYRVIEKAVTAVDTTAAKAAKVAVAASQKKAVSKPKATQRRKATPATAPAAKATPVKKATKKVDGQKYIVAKDATRRVKEGTVLSAILAAVKKPATREEIIAAVVSGDWRPPKSKADFPGYVRGYLSHAITQRILTASV
jgi:hypothetical protein